MVHFCYLKLYLGLETVSFCLFPRMSWMEMDGNLKKLVMPAENHQKNYYYRYCSLMKIVLDLFHNSTHAFFWTTRIK